MLFASLLLLADEAAHAAGDHGHDHGDHGHHAEHLPLTGVLENPAGQMYPVIATIVVFLLVFGILATVVWPKILGGLEDRQQKIQGDIEQAEQSRAEAEKAKADFEAQLAEARKQAAETVAQAKADAQRVADELRAANDAELTQLRTKAMADIESAKSAAVAEIHAEAGSLATAVASKILGREITVADQQQLVQESLAEMKG